ncbi:MAG: sensor histidine kinase, partial [Shewanella sp.]
MLPMTQIAKKRLLMTLVLLVGLFVTLKLTYWVHWHQGTLEIQTQSERQLTELVNFLDAALSRYE